MRDEPYHTSEPYAHRKYTIDHTLQWRRWAADGLTLRQIAHRAGASVSTVARLLSQQGRGELR